jgi:putative tricarboxylic transport membrane protein
MTEGPGPRIDRRRPDWAALPIALALFAMAAAIIWDMARLANVATYARIGPQTVPYAIAICLVGLGIWAALEAWRGDFPEREPQELRSVIWIVAGLMAQLVLLRPTGFSIATGVLFGLVAYGLGRKPLHIGIPVGIVLSFIVWVIFARGLQLSLPAGPIETAFVALLRGPAA